VRRAFLAGVAIAVLVPGGAAVAGWFHTDDPAKLVAKGPEHSTMVGDLTVSVARAQKRVVAEHDTTYLIRAVNHGDTPTTLTLRAMVPPWLEISSAHGGAHGNGYVDWPTTLNPGDTATARLTGAYASPGAQVPGRAAFTVCALTPESTDPLACATDFAQIRAPFWATWGWPLAGLVLLALVTAAVLRLRRHRTLQGRLGSAGPATAPAG
jgi:hypothetical protein